MSTVDSWGLLLAPQDAMLTAALSQSPGWLSHSEQLRFATLKSDKRQSIFLASRYALRLLLAQEHSAPIRWFLGSAAERGPWVENVFSTTDINALRLPQLSLSHSGTWLACAKAPVSVGVDLEVQHQNRQRNVQALSALVCTPVEQTRLLGLPPEMQQQAFMQLWCLKEAYFKCVGTGVDFEKIRQLTWRGPSAESMPESPRDTKPIACARLWQCKLTNGDTIYLALCALCELPKITPLEAAISTAIHWQSSSEWRCTWM